MSNRPVTTGVVLVAGAVALAFPALAVALWTMDRDYDFQDVVGLFVITAVPAVVGAGAALLLGRRLVPRMRTPAPGPTAAARAALRAGRATDPAVDAAARREADRRIDQRWYVWLCALGIVAQGIVLLGSAGPSTRVTAGVLILAWAGTGWWRWRGIREARRYLDAAPVPSEKPTGADGGPSTPIGGGFREPAG
ncbi:hypothetical protein [Micromonospora sp. WMMD980]|uniref:hypothetical protein n=1 Tax=Micromonospora sp. WMMD980 TaxID=3016088 RepID=UPI0024170D84|nr:hypothetical protein [Micromonospora sp. WMMD980]MDG4802482.1 hypothetical protein [Micromonospora sp. WMMD980]